MRRARLRLFVLALVVAALGWIAYRVVADVVALRRSDLVNTALQLVPDAAQRIEDFRRVKLQDGQPVWEISAREAQYFESDQRVVIRNPEMIFYEAGAEKARLHSDKGQLVLDGKELQTVEMQGAVQLEASGLTLRTDAATYMRERDAIVAPGQVTISGPDLTVEGSDMEVTVSTQRLTLRRRVRVTLTNRDDRRS
jgi:LPS export ABC transporter protein LptC